MKRNLLLFLVFILTGVGAYFALRTKKAQRLASTTTPDMEFAIRNTDDIYKIFIADRTGQSATLERTNGHWTYNNQFKARPSAIELLLETMSRVNVWYIPPDAAESSMIRSLAAEGLKVEAYDKAGNLMKAYYVGGTTNDERGTFMMMEGAEQPYVVHIPSFVGQLRVRYLLGDDNWRDRMIFEEKPEEIKSVTVEYPQQKSESFRLEKTGEAAYQVTPFYSTTRPAAVPQRKGVAEAYLLGFEKLGAEAYENRDPRRDSIMSLVPFAIVKVTKEDGTTKEVRFWPDQIQGDPSAGKGVINRYFAACSWGPFALTQDVVFGPVFRGYGFFFENPAVAPALKN